LNVYGAYPSQKVLQLNNIKEGFMIKVALMQMKWFNMPVLASCVLVQELKEIIRSYAMWNINVTIYGARIHA
jgi:hypothetical protein